MRRLVTVLVSAIVAGLALGPALVRPASASPGDCPPACDSVPASAWITPGAIPLFAVYKWPWLSSVAAPAGPPRWKFEDECGTPPAGDARTYAVAARAVVPQPDRQWQLQSQVLHWRGDVGSGGQSAQAALRAAANAVRNCQSTAPTTSPSITTDQPDRVAAVLSADGQRVLHTYLLAHPRSSSVVELSLWATTPPLVDWPSVFDQQVFDAMTGPLCTAYIGSCR